MQPVRFNVIGQARAYGGRITSPEKLSEIIGEHLTDFGPGSPAHNRFDRAVFQDGAIVAVIRKTGDGVCEVTRFPQ